MRTFLKTFSMMAVAAVAGVSVTSCTSDKDLYNPEVVKENVKAEYAANFVKAFGEVSETKNWDMSNYKAQIVTRGATEISTERVAGLDFGVRKSIFGKFSVTKNTDLYNEITKSIFKENVPKTGQPAVLLAPDNDFTIYPIGTQTGAKYKMYVQVGDNDPELIFNKDWNDHDIYYVNDMKKALPGLHVSAPVGTPIEIWIDRTDGTRPNIYGTSNGMAITVESQVRPDGVDPNATVKYVGIEDWTQGDMDYNDLVIAIVGNPDAPEPIIIQDDYYTKEIARPAKRYMIEDLGTTDDFDFNDVVVDVMDVISQKYHVTIVNGKKDSEEPVGDQIHSQKAFIRALGGTMDFILKIGNTTWKKSDNANAAEMINTETPEYGKTLFEFDVTGWEPELNNVSLKVVDELGNTIEFPKQGAIPMMFATSTRTDWMTERQKIPAAWVVE